MNAILNLRAIVRRFRPQSKPGHDIERIVKEAGGVPVPVRDVAGFRIGTCGAPTAPPC